MFHSLDFLQLFDYCHLQNAKDVVAEFVARQLYWQICREVGTNRNFLNKLRFYRLFKRFFATEEYCKLNMPFTHSAASAKFRCGVVPLNMETESYVGQPFDARICPFCSKCIEDEQHVILHCPAFDTIYLEINSL